MKQHITLDQLNELTEEQKKKLPTQWIHQNHDRDSDSWCYTCSDSVNHEDKTQYEPQLLSLGQMIEFLFQYPERFYFGHDYWKEKKTWYWCVQETWEPEAKGIKNCWDEIELVDALWEAVKEKLK